MFSSVRCFAGGRVPWARVFLCFVHSFGLLEFSFQVKFLLPITWANLLENVFHWVFVESARATSSVNLMLSRIASSYFWSTSSSFFTRRRFFLGGSNFGTPPKVPRVGERKTRQYYNYGKRGSPA